ncbi:hypothetical protein ACFQV5_07055 [Paenibacillus sp. GCM10028914]
MGMHKVAEETKRFWKSGSGRLKAFQGKLTSEAYKFRFLLLTKPVQEIWGQQRLEE